MIVVLFLAVLEISGRYAFRHHIAFLNEVDHRLTPNTNENNADGIRCEKESQNFQPDDVNIIFLGDSFVYGYKLAPQFAFPQQFEVIANTHHPELTINVANFAWTSASPYLSLRLLKDIGVKYNPDVVFLCIDMTDFHDDLRYEYFIERPKAIYKLMAYCPGIVFTLEMFLDISCSYFEAFEKLYKLVFSLPNDHFFIVNEPLEQTRKYCSNILTNINNTYEYVVNDLDAHFILAILPRSFQYSAQESPKNWESALYTVLGPYVYEPFKLFNELQDVNYPIYSLLEDFKDTTVFPTCFYDDPHWNTNGHKIAAEKMYEIARREHLFEK